MQNNQLALIAVVAALSMLGIVVLTVTVTIPIQLGVVAITIVSIPLQQAEARGCPISSRGVNASAGRCFHP